MIVNADSLAAIFTSYKAHFARGLAHGPSDLQQFATEVPSTGKSNKYPLGALTARMREWVGDRHVTNLAAYIETLTNLKFELTVSVPRDDIEDDTWGVYGPSIQAMGESGALEPSRQLHDALGSSGAAFATAIAGLDSQPFFDAGHSWPGAYETAQGNLGTEALDSDAVYTAVNAMAAFKGPDGQFLNVKPDTFVGGTGTRSAAEALFLVQTTAAGAGNPHFGRIAKERIHIIPEMSTNYWALLDCSKAIKPAVYQNRRAIQLVSKVAETDDNVFDRAEYVYGIDGRWKVAWLCWWLAYGSNGTT